ncbi:MAG: hypothetical protein U0003_02705 [Vampirovibrionales bacterium]
MTLSGSASLTSVNVLPGVLHDGLNTDEQPIVEAVYSSVQRIQAGLQGQHALGPVVLPAVWPAHETLTYSLHTLIEQVWASVASQKPPVGGLVEPGKKEVALDIAVDFEVYQAALKGLATVKTVWLNHTALCKPLALQTYGLTRSAVLLEADTPQWMADWCVQLAQLWPVVNRLTTALGRGVPTVVARWLALSAPVLYAWAYPDSATHAGQVSRLCVKTSQRLGHRPVQQLQALLVGWIHDPKLDSPLSIDNVATHPIVASALASLWLNEKVLAQALESLIPQESERRTWHEGLMMALAINNDSRYVAEQLIVPALSNQLKQQQNEACIPPFVQRVRSRFTAPSHQAALQGFDALVVEALNKTHLDSGLVGIDGQVWQQLVANEPGGALLYDNLCSGTMPESVFIQWHQRLQAAIAQQAADEPVLYHWPVNGLALMLHHQGVLAPAQPAALALALSDPLLLSPHKIVQARPSNEVLLDRLRSYVQSLRDNVAALPLLPGAHPLNRLGPQWHRAVQEVLAMTLKLLTHEPPPMVGEEPVQRDYFSSAAGAAWDELLSPEAWGVWGRCTEMTNPQTLVHVTRVLEQQYLKHIEPLLKE